MEVVSEGQLVIKNVDGVDEYVDDLPLVFGIVDVAILETGNPIHDLLLGVARALDLSLRDTQLEALFLFLQLLQPFLCGLGENTHLDSVEHILNGLFTFRQLVIQRRERGVFPFL